ncbi:uncharacterized protein BDZ99DRAFT_571436 [Mytilinidion resinicola]|uniref:Uncharacterized protein n=1 Tax=Mytilinidion resinicola TaxID=574789 RepID=A0A6A6YM98_9PEZI|nr:uncharacterized protein BDZ99DRAFT_571436 [Mytilinidion resinicola]KAF2809658.1 hypothetical protein BDZ99DRAFT_571436 [Mytilinidion resinicola]
METVIDAHGDDSGHARDDGRARYNAAAPALTKLLIVACVVLYCSPLGVRHAVRDVVGSILTVLVGCLVFCVMLCVAVAAILYIALREEAEQERGPPVGIDAGMMIERRRGMGS